MQESSADHREVLILKKLQFSQLRTAFAAPKAQIAPRTGTKDASLPFDLWGEGMLWDGARVQNYRLVGALELHARAVPDMAVFLQQAPKKAGQRSSLAYRQPIIATGCPFQLKSGRATVRRLVLNTANQRLSTHSIY